MKKTKILATYGPSIASVPKVRKLISSGVNLFRINCSHGNMQDFLDAARVIRQGSKGSLFPVGLLMDISGPKLRLARFEGEFTIKEGQKLSFTTGRSNLKTGVIGVNHPAVIKSVKVGHRLFVDDGRFMFKVIRSGPQKILAQSLSSGTLTSAKGINLPDSKIDIPTITPKDREDIKTAVRLDADYIAISFVRSGDDIIEAKKIIKKFGGRQKVIAKLEKREAIDNLDEIMLLSDGVMIARGDLGVELPPEEIPHLQKRITTLANRHHLPVIVATQMMESMRFSPRATRAEISDVATAVFDHVDAVMLSAETATGRFPVETVTTMVNVIEATEKNARRPRIELETHLIKSKIPFAISHAVTNADDQCPTQVIFAFTTSGFTAQMISNLYPSQPIIALTTNHGVMSQLALYRSVYPVHIDQPGSFDDMVAVVNKIALKFKLVRLGQKVIITGGAPFGTTVPTNFMMFYEIGQK